MPAYKDDKTGRWFASFYFTNWQGKSEKKMKRGFATKREALVWERSFLHQKNGDLNMSFAAFVEVYKKDVRSRIREHTWMTKEPIIDTKLLPFFGDKKVSEIRTKDVIAWQNQMMDFRNKSGKAYSPTYLKTLHNQLSAILNHAVRHYELKENVAAKVGPIGKKEATEMLFWTKEEYFKFADAMMDKSVSYYAFEVLYWCGLRLGELLALTPADFDFAKETVSITKSYQRLKGEDVITAPKTPKSVRVVQMPTVLAEEMQEYLGMLYGIEDDERIFQISKSYLHHEMDRGSKAAGVKRIRVHDLRHSHVSLLIEMGFSALAIAGRVGHESIDITYRYAHMFPSTQLEMAEKLNDERKEGGY
jgi:integrase